MKFRMIYYKSTWNKIYINDYHSVYSYNSITSLIRLPKIFFLKMNFKGQQNSTVHRHHAHQAQVIRHWLRVNWTTEGFRTKEVGSEFQRIVVAVKKHHWCDLKSSGKWSISSGLAISRQNFIKNIWHNTPIEQKI